MAVNVTIRGAVAGDPPPPPTGANEGRLLFLNYSGSGFWNYVSGGSLTQWQKDHWDYVEQFLPYADAYTDDIPIIRYVDANAVYPTVAGGNIPSAPQYCLKDSAGNYVKFYGNSEFLTDVGLTSWWDFIISKCQEAKDHGYIGVKLDDVNLGTIQYSTPLPPINPRTGLTYTASDWNNDFANGLTRVRNAFPKGTFTIVHNSVWWRHPLDNADILRAAQQCDVYEHERGFIINGDVPTLWAYCDQLASYGVKSLFLASGAQGDTLVEAEFQLACGLMASHGGDWYMNEFQTPTNWWFKNDYDLGDAISPRVLLTPGNWRRDFTNGYATVNLSAQTGSVVLT